MAQQQQTDFGDFNGSKSQNMPPPYQSPPASYQSTPSPYPQVQQQQQQPNQQAYGEPPLCGGPPPTIVIHNVAYFGTGPQTITCPNCRQMVLTRVDYQNGAAVWIICLIICLFGGIFGCCLIPFCVDSLKDVIHYCPACNSQIGMRKVM